MDIAEKKTIDCKVVTLDGVTFSEQIEQITIPTTSGEITVLPRHTALVSILKAGDLRIKKNGETQKLAITGGILEVRPNSQVIILAN